MLVMDINTVRKANIRRLIDDVGSVKAFASKVGTDPAYVSAILSPKINRNPGDQFMRRIEKAFELPQGALDFPDETAMAAALALQSLPDEARRQAFDFIRYKIETAPPQAINQEIAQSYLELLEQQPGQKAKRTTSKTRKTPG